MRILAGNRRNGVLFYIGAVSIVVRWKPSSAPLAAEQLPITRRDFWGVICVVGLFLIIMVGIYGGFITPSEAAAIGAMGMPTKVSSHSGLPIFFAWHCW